MAPDRPVTQVELELAEERLRGKFDREIAALERKVDANAAAEFSAAHVRAIKDIAAEVYVSAGEISSSVRTKTYAAVIFVVSVSTFLLTLLLKLTE